MTTSLRAQSSEFSSDLIRPQFEDCSLSSRILATWVATLLSSFESRFRIFQTRLVAFTGYVSSESSKELFHTELGGVTWVFNGFTPGLVQNGDMIDDPAGIRHVSDSEGSQNLLTLMTLGIVDSPKNSDGFQDR